MKSFVVFYYIFLYQKCNCISQSEGSRCNQDTTDESNVRYSTSEDAVEASIGHLSIVQDYMREKSQYPEAADDNGFIRNVGLSNINQSRRKRAAGFGQIWYITQPQFEEMSQKTNAQKEKLIEGIEKSLNIKWADVEFNDLTKPKISMLAFLLHLHTQPQVLWPIRDSESFQSKLCGQINSCNTKQFIEQYKLYKKEIESQCAEQDIVFVVDSSGSVGENGFKNVKTFIVKAIDELDIAAGGSVNLAVVFFGDSARTAITFNEKDKQIIKKKIENTAWLNQGTNTGEGLTRAKELLAGSTGTKKTIALFTDGATTNTDTYTRAIMEISYAGIIRKAFAFDNSNGSSAFKANADNQKELAEFNSDIRYISSNDFEDSVLSLIKEICTAKIILTQETNQMTHKFKYQPTPLNQKSKLPQRLDLQLETDNVYKFVEIKSEKRITVFVDDRPKPNARTKQIMKIIEPNMPGKIPFYGSKTKFYLSIKNDDGQDNTVNLKLTTSRRKRRSTRYVLYHDCQSNEKCYFGTCICQDNQDLSGYCPPEKFNLADIKLYEDKKLYLTNKHYGYGYDYTYQTSYELW